MLDPVTQLMAEYGLTFSEVWLLGMVSIMFSQPLLWAIILSILFGRMAMLVVRVVITFLSVLPIGANGLVRFKQFILIGSYISAQTTRNVPIRKITRARRLWAYLLIGTRLFPDYLSVRMRDFERLCRFAEDGAPWGSEVWYNGVVIKVTWYPNFRWGNNTNQKKL